MDSVQEGSHEAIDRVWRRWLQFCQNEVGAIDPLLHDAPTADVGLLLRAFFERYRRADFRPDGSIRGERETPMVATTIKGSASSLSAAFRNHLERSPLHIQGSNRYIPSLKRLFQAFTNLSPADKRQKAITPKLLKKLGSFTDKTNIRNTADDHAADLIVGSYFFAMRACEYVKTPKPERTVLACLRCVVFRDHKREIISHHNPDLRNIALYVTITSEDQNNKQKNDVRTQRRTRNKFLCPVKRFGTAIQRSTPRIMFLGRWLSDAFLVYIRPQVLEWTNNMSSDMINIADFIDIGLCDRASPSDPRLQQTPKSKNGLSSRMTMPTMNMDF